MPQVHQEAKVEVELRKEQEEYEIWVNKEVRASFFLEREHGFASDK